MSERVLPPLMQEKKKNENETQNTNHTPPPPPAPPHEVEPCNLVHYGILPDFVGRFPVIVFTSGLSLEQLVRVLSKHTYSHTHTPPPPLFKNRWSLVI